MPQYFKEPHRHELVLADDPVAVRVERVKLGLQRRRVHAGMLRCSVATCQHF